jgi:hypothetical protein
MPFVADDGRITQWPVSSQGAAHGGRLARAIASKTGRVYSEMDVNMTD